MARKRNVGSSGIAAVMSNTFGRIAALLAHKALEVESEGSNSPDRFLIHDAYVTGSIIASVSFLETVANDMFSCLSLVGTGRTWPERNKVFSRLWALGIPRTAAYPILQKYQVALILVGREPFTTGRNPFQDAQSVVALRNELVHYEPSFESLVGEGADEHTFPPHKLACRLKGKFPLSPLCAPHAPMWPYKLLGAGCANWAVMSAINFTSAFAARFPVQHISRSIVDMTDGIREEATHRLGAD